MLYVGGIACLSPAPRFSARHLGRLPFCVWEQSPEASRPRRQHNSGSAAIGHDGGKGSLRAFPFLFGFLAERGHACRPLLSTDVCIVVNPKRRARDPFCPFASATAAAAVVVLIRGRSLWPLTSTPTPRGSWWRRSEQAGFRARSSPLLGAPPFFSSFPSITQLGSQRSVAKRA